MLSALLKKNLIVFQLIPVVGYTDLKNKYGKLDDSISNVMMLGCGSMVDLESFLGIDVNSYLDKEFYDSVITPQSSSQIDQTDLKLTRKIYIIDGHRPWNLDNLFGSQLVNCFDDGTAREELEEEKAAYNYLISIEGEEGEPVNEEEKEQAESDIEDLAGSDDDGSENRGSDSEDSGSAHPSESSRKRTSSSSQPSAKKKRTQIKDNERKIEDYYNQGTTVTTSSSLQMYTLLSTIGESNIDYLWLSIIGTTSLNASFGNVYDEIAPLLKEEVNRLQADYSSSNSGSPDTDLGKKADNHSLQIDKEYSLFLLRHWNLYDSFFYSNYVNSKLQLYTTEGKKKLKTMFARMGISLVSACQNWHYLDLDLKRRINSIFTKNLAQLGLTDVIRDGFIRNFGFHGSISAGDFVEAVTALLEYDGDLGSSRKENGRTGTPPDDKEGSAEPEETADKLTRLIAKREAQFISNFWKAYDSLTRFELVIKGISIAKLQQKFIFEKGFEILQKRMIKNLRIFRLVVLKDSFTSNSTITDISINNFAPSRHSALIGSANSAASSALNEKDTVDFHTLGSRQKLFQNPLILTKLGNWILEACAEMDGSPLPLVIASLDIDTGTYLVCGLPPKYPNMKGLDEKLDEKQRRDKTTVLNTFSLAFQEIANSTGAKARIDSFESSIIEIRREDLSVFLERLTLSGLV
ncbi:DEKNAAC104284 [Brettanomyces naardenensis]|uniref:DEKNAAC104284 n=1 Tax=Brettanomyces naardenensis TaxID=13370 RepID=A0A448YPT5_BRENA|nr:DEKNAAC104284 [Brettanomyces naardenensis]